MTLDHLETVVVVGAGPAGLAVAACLRRRGVAPVVLERGAAVGDSWRAHYDRLHLHTPNRLSHLPGLRFPREAGRYPSRDEMVRYLERYAAQHGIEPRLGAEVRRATPTARGWRVEYDGQAIEARNLAIASGYNGTPCRPTWPGLASFPGPVLHSASYRSGAPFRGQAVLVVGFGNSGGEIALDLHAQGAQPTLAVRSPVNVTPRDLFGIPALAVSLALMRLPARVADLVGAPAIALRYGDIGRYGLRKSGKGPFRQIIEDRRIPLIDIGTIAAIRRGAIRVRPGIERLEGSRIHFADGRSEAFDAVVLATGFRPSFDRFLEGAGDALGPDGVPLVSGDVTAVPGLFFCGFHVSPTGMLRAIGAEARRIARRIGGAA